MIINRIRQSYAFNFLALYGFISSMVYFCIYMHYIIIEEFKHIFDVVVMMSIFLIGPIAIFNIFGIFLSVLVLVFEILLSLKISNMKFLKNKFIFYIQILSIILLLIPEIILLLWK